MSILGKVLIVFNLLAAGAFAYFTLENWKVRKDLTRAAVVREHPARRPAGRAAGRPAGRTWTRTDAAFEREVNKVPYESHPEGRRSTRPSRPGARRSGAGGEPITDQTAEVKRVQDKVFKTIPAAGRARTRTCDTSGCGRTCLAVARTGAERDGVNAVFDMRDPSRAYAARRDLPLAARTDSQTAALRALVEVADLGRTRRTSPRPTGRPASPPPARRSSGSPSARCRSGPGPGDTAEAEAEAGQRRRGRLPGRERRGGPAGRDRRAPPRTRLPGPGGGRGRRAAGRPGEHRPGGRPP